MRLNVQPRVAIEDPAMQRVLRESISQINLLAEGRISAVYNAAANAPTVGANTQGDFLRNSTPSELGAAGSKYVVFGFLCTVGGTPGTWVQCRFLTGG